MTLQCLSTQPSRGTLLGASGSRIYEIKDSSVLSTIDVPLQPPHEQGQVRCLLGVTQDNVAYIIACTDDKWVLVFRYEDSAWALSRRHALPKRANNLAFNAGSSEIVVGDKFGDVFCLPLVGDDVLQVKNDPPILGHVSLLLAILLHGDKIITADRDEHIRVSLFPKSYIIDAFLLGSKFFVSALCIVDDYLISGGGDPTLQVFSLNTSKLHARVSLEALAPYTYRIRDEMQNPNTPVFAIRSILRLGSNILIFSTRASAALAIPVNSVIRGSNEGSRIIELPGPFVEAVNMGPQVVVSLEKIGCVSIDDALHIESATENIGSDPEESLLYPLLEVLKSYENTDTNSGSNTPTQNQGKNAGHRSGKRASGRARIEQNYERAKSQRSS